MDDVLLLRTLFFILFLEVVTHESFARQSQILFVKSQTLIIWSRGGQIKDSVNSWHGSGKVNHRGEMHSNGRNSRWHWSFFRLKLITLSWCFTTNYAGGPRGATPRMGSRAVVVRRYSSSKVSSSGCTLLEQRGRDTPRPRWEKPK